MAKEKDSSQTAEHWKRKFYTGLDELEQKEKEWTELEKILRTLASRLSFTATGHNKQLDKQLDQLREALRSERNSYKVASIAQQVTSNVSQLEVNETKSPASFDIARPLTHLLDQINIPNSLERQESFVRKKISKAGDVSAVDDVVKDVAELLGLVIDAIAQLRSDNIQEKNPQLTQQKVTSVKEPTAESQIEKSGMFSGLFGKQKVKSDVGQQKVSPIPQDTQSDLIPESQQQPLTSEQKKEQAISIDDELPDANDVHDIDDEEKLLSLAADTLIRLLERLQLPGDLHIQADLIKHKLEPCGNSNLLASGLEATADLLAELSRRVQAERKALEDFLIQLRQRLHDLDTDVRETVRLRQQSQQAGQEIKTAVNQEVSHIEQSMHAAVDLDSLKTAIQSRVILLRDHMDRFLKDEDGRYSESEKIIKKLNMELQLANHETETMRQQVVEARQAAMHDQLTGIANRMSYDENMATELARFKRYKTPFTLMVWDIDKFKNVNDSFGHAAGDKVLMVIANLFTNNVRETDMLARYGGEEFVIILPETVLEQAKPLAEKLRAAVEATEFHFRGQPVKITASCGLAEAQTSEDQMALFKRADAALYRAKENGRNRFELAVSVAGTVSHSVND